MWRRLGYAWPAWPGALGTDAVLAAGLTAAECVAGAGYHPAGWPRLDLLGYLLMAGGALPLAVRRRAPVLVLVACCLFYAAYVAGGYPPSVSVWAPMIAFYTVAAERGPRVTALAAAVTGGVLFASGLSSGAMPVLVASIQAVAVVAIIWTVGAMARRLADGNARMAALAQQLREEQAGNARRAVTEERFRIARELHDVVTHHMAVVSVQAGLAQYVFTSDPDAARGAVDTIAATSHEALNEMRRLLNLLRIAPGDPRLVDDPSPGLDRLADLAGQIAATGLPVEIHTAGTPRPLPPGLSLCAYRVIQESLTNVLRHAGPAPTTIHLDYGWDAFRVRVVNEPPRVPPQPSPTSGLGLIGMRERAEIYGGTLRTGARPDGGYEVVLTIPLRFPSTPDVARSAEREDGR